MQGTPAKETKIQDLLDALMGEAPAETTAAPTTAGTNTACQDLERKSAMTWDFTIISFAAGASQPCPVLTRFIHLHSKYHYWTPILFWDMF